MKIKQIFRRKSSREIAKDRLKILLISDRVSCSPETMQSIKSDIIKVISKYMKIDTNNADIQIVKKDKKNRELSNPILYINMPIIDIGSTGKSKQ